MEREKLELGREGGREREKYGGREKKSMTGKREVRISKRGMTG